MSFILFCNYFSAMVITLLSKRSVAATCLKHSCLWAWNFLEIFFFIETYCWQSLVYKTFTKMIQCVFMFPIKFWNENSLTSFTFPSWWRGPYFFIKWLCLFALASRITICSQVTKFLQHDLQELFFFRRRMKYKTVRTFAVRALILIFREFLKSTGED